MSLSRTVLSEQLKEILLKRILSGEYKSGDRLVEMQIAQEFEISQAPVRAALEEVAARLAAKRLAGNVKALEAELAAMYAAAEKGDLDEQVQHDVEFHRLIVEASGNRVLQDVWRSLRIEARTLISVLKTDIGGHEIAEMHRPVLEALAEGDAERAGLLLRQHVEYFGELILKEDR